MADPQKVAVYSKQIAALQAKGVNTPQALLLVLLRTYAFEVEDSANPLVKFGKFLQKKTHSRNYQEYVTTKISSFEAHGAKPISEFIDEIDQNISTAEGRQANKLTKSHDKTGHFHAMWVAFFNSYPNTFADIEAGNSLLSTCKSEAVKEHPREADAEPELEAIPAAANLAVGMEPAPELKAYTASFNTYVKLIDDLNDQRIKESTEVLLHLLWAYAEILEAQDETYKNYILSKLEDFSAVKKISLDDIVVAIDKDISGSEEERKQHGIIKPHNSLGNFQSLWVTFAVKYPLVLNAEKLTAANSIIGNCIKEAEHKRMEQVEKGVWQIIGKKAGSRAIDIALTDTKRHRFLKDSTADAIAQRRQFLHHVEEWEIEKVREMLEADSGLVIEPWYNAERDVIRIACLDQNKKMYDLLISHLPKIEDDEAAAFQAQLNECHYLVRGGQRGRAEQFLEKFELATRERLIFSRNYQGFSAIEYYQLDEDVEGRLRLYRQLTPNPAELKLKYKELYPDDIKPEQEEASWDAYLEFLMSKLDAKYKTLAREHINNIADNPSLAEQTNKHLTKLKNSFQKMIGLYENKEWKAGDDVWKEEIGKLQRKLPRWLLYEIVRPDKPFNEKSEAC